MKVEIGRYIRVVVTVLLAFAVVYGTHRFCKNDLIRNQDSKKPLIVGMMAGYVPFMSIGESGEPEGFDVGVANELAKRMNRPLEICAMDLAELLMALSRNKIDLLISGMTMTPARIKKIDMVHYFGGGMTTTPLVFWKSIPSGIKTFKDVNDKGLKVVVEGGSSQEEIAEIMGIKNVRNFNKILDMIMEIKRGKSDSILFEADIIAWYQAKFPELKVVQLPLEGKFEILGLGIGVNKGHSELKNAVEKNISDMRQDGTLGRIEGQWDLR